MIIRILEKDKYDFKGLTLSYLTYCMLPMVISVILEKSLNGSGDYSGSLDIVLLALFS